MAKQHTEKEAKLFFENQEKLLSEENISTIHDAYVTDYNRGNSKIPILEGMLSISDRQEENLKEISLEELLGSELDVTDADVMLQWQQGRNGSRGGWQSLKLVLNIDADEDEKVENKK